MFNRNCSLSFIVENLFCKKKIYNYLIYFFPNTSIFQIKFKILNDHVYLNNKIIKNYNILIKENDIISLIMIKNYFNFKCFKNYIYTLYEDEYLIVINKPPGIIIHPINVNEINFNSITNHLISKSNHLSTIRGIMYSGIIHRLDKNTSGLLIIAKNNFIQSHISKQINHKKLKRNYLALIYNKSLIKNNFIISRLYKYKKKYINLENNFNKNGKISITKLSKIKSFEKKKISLINCELETGRMHQIRIHMSNQSTPIIGDNKYIRNFNKSILPYFIKEKINLLSQQLLHSYKVKFIHPVKKKLFIFNISINNNIRNFIDSLKNDI